MAVSKVVVVDGNNLIVRIDRGVAGRSVTDVEPVEIDNALYLVFSFSDGTTETIGPVGTIQYIGQTPIVVTGSTISLSTVPINLGGTNATTAANARTNLNAANQDTTITAGTGLSGGGSLAANRTINIANTAVTAGAYGASSNTLSATVNAQGQLTALSEAPIAIVNTQISGLGTMSTQNANSVTITGGSVTGITDLTVLDGGTGASDASGARTNLGAAASATTISAGTGLSGGGDLSANRTLAIANTGVTVAAYGSASKTLTATVNAQGQLTVLADTNIAIANTQVSGLGTSSTLNAAVALGVATLDSGGTVPLSQIPSSIQGGVSYQGSWNASTNTPTLTSSIGTKGYYYVVSVAGSTNLNGITDWLPGDWAIFNGSVWEQIDNTDSVTSVNGYTGSVVLTSADVGAPPTTRTISTGTGLTGGGDLSANRTIAIDSTVATLTGTQTLTNKTINLASNTLQATSAEIAAAVTDETGTGALVFANSPTLVTPNLGTPSALVGTNISGTATNLTAGNVTTNANLTGAITSTGNATLLGSFTSANLAGALTDETGTGSAVFSTSPTLVTPVLGTPSSVTLTNATGLPVSTGISGLGTGVATALAVNVGSAGAPVINGGVLGTPSSGTVTNLTGTASININGTVGATTATTGAFTTLSASGDVTLSGATANGVVYANASKVLTTGSALTFDGTSLQVSSNLISGLSGGSNGTLVLKRASDGLTVGTLAVNSANSRLELATAYDPITFSNFAGEQMRLTSTGLGIGTSSPALPLDVVSNSGANAISIRGRAADDIGTLGFYTNAGSNIAQIQLRSDEMRLLASGARSQTFYTNGSERMRLDASGNLGLGVTPSAFSSAYKAFQFGQRGALYAHTSVSATNLADNAYDDGTAVKYIVTGTAQRYQMSAGQHQFYTAPSGTAGDAISFSQVMTLDASGNLGVGTTSPAYQLTVGTVGSTADAYIQIGSTTSGTGNLFFGDTAGLGSGSFAGYIQYQHNVDAMLFGTNNTERARIDSSGNLLVGQTSGGARLNITAAASQNGVNIVLPSDNYLGATIHSTATSGDNQFIAFGTETSFTTRGSISYNRAAGLTVYATTSDYRAKDIIGPVTDSGALIDSTPVYMGKMHGATQERPMFIAHEVPAYAHTGEKDTVDADGNPVYQQMDASALIPVMWAEIQSLRKRLAAANI